LQWWRYWSTTSEGKSDARQARAKTLQEPTSHPHKTNDVYDNQRARSVRAREIGKLARKHRNRYSLQQVYEIVRDIWQIERDAMTTKRKRERMKEEKKKKEAMK
jgi:DNA polymerase III delta subunit